MYPNMWYGRTQARCELRVVEDAPAAVARSWCHLLPVLLPAQRARGMHVLLECTGLGAQPGLAELS